MLPTVITTELKISSALVKYLRKKRNIMKQWISSL